MFGRSYVGSAHVMQLFSWSNLGKAWSLSVPVSSLLSLSSKFTFHFLLYDVGAVSLKQFPFASKMLSFVSGDYEKDMEKRRVFPPFSNALTWLAPGAPTASLPPNSCSVGGFYGVQHLQYMVLSSTQKTKASLGMCPAKVAFVAEYP